jgi:hypothetical protein
MIHYIQNFKSLVIESRHTVLQPFVWNMYKNRYTDSWLQAENEGGRFFKSGHITVEFKPTFEDQPMTKEWSWDQRPVNLTCIGKLDTRHSTQLITVFIYWAHGTACCLHAEYMALAYCLPSGHMAQLIVLF